jgi:uncharacterized membrane protein
LLVDGFSFELVLLLVIRFLVEFVEEAPRLLLLLFLFFPGRIISSSELPPSDEESSLEELLEEDELDVISIILTFLLVKLVCCRVPVVPSSCCNWTDDALMACPGVSLKIGVKS